MSESCLAAGEEAGKRSLRGKEVHLQRPVKELGCFGLQVTAMRKFNCLIRSLESVGFRRILAPPSRT